MGKWLKGILILAVLAFLASFIWPFNANKRSAAMGVTIQNALNANGFDFAKVNMSGNVARLTGTAPNESASAAAVALAENTKCETCAEKTPWHRVANDLEYNKIATASPYVFNATKSAAGSVVLDGYVRNEAEKARVLREAENLFPGKVTDRTIKIAQGQPNANWGDVVSLNLNEIAMLERGRFNMEDSQSFISGLASDEAKRSKINQMVASLPAGYKGASNITIPEAPAPSPEATCQTLFAEIKADSKVNFASASAALNGAPSFDLLNKLATAANAPECASFRIAVVGHTDSQGDAGYNLELSRKRANSVVAYLADNGVELSRMSYEGMGETKPIADNSTSAGMAKNRRIEFIITQAQ